MGKLLGLWERRCGLTKSVNLHSRRRRILSCAKERKT